MELIRSNIVFYRCEVTGNYIHYLVSLVKDTSTTLLDTLYIISMNEIHFNDDYSINKVLEPVKLDKGFYLERMQLIYAELLDGKQLEGFTLHYPHFTVSLEDFPQFMCKYNNTEMKYNNTEIHDYFTRKRETEKSGLRILLEGNE